MPLTCKQKTSDVETRIREEWNGMGGKEGRVQHKESAVKKYLCSNHFVSNFGVDHIRVINYGGPLGQIFNL